MSARYRLLILATFSALILAACGLPPTNPGAGQPSAAPAATIPAVEPTVGAVTTPTFEAVTENAPTETPAPAAISGTLDWRNDGNSQHSATAVDKSFDTKLFGPGGSQSVTFGTPGSFRYFCILHGASDGASGMVGTVIVE